MQIVIDIPEEQYCRIMQSHRRGVERFVSKEAMMYAIKTGTPLPKGHSNLIDSNKAFVLLNEQIDKHDKMMAKYEPYSNNQIPLWWWKGVCRESTVIEADTKNT